MGLSHGIGLFRFQNKPFFPLGTLSGRSIICAANREQTDGEEEQTIRDRRTRRRIQRYVMTYAGNEALDRTVYCYAALFILQNYVDPHTHRDLGQTGGAGPRWSSVQVGATDRLASLPPAYSRRPVRPDRSVASREPQSRRGEHEVPQPLV